MNYVRTGRRTDGRKDRLINGILSQTQVKSHTADRAATAAEKRRGVIIIYSVVTKFQWISHHSTPPILLNISQILLQPNMIRGKNSHQLMFSPLGLGITLGYPQKCSTNEPANQTVQPLGRPFARNYNVVILTWSTTSSPLLSFPLYAVAGSTGQVPSTSNRPSHLLTIIISITRSGRQHLLPLVVSSFFPQLVNQASRQAQSVSHHQRRHLPFLYRYDTEEHCGILTKVRKSFTSDSLWVFYKI